MMTECHTNCATRPHSAAKVLLRFAAFFTLEQYRKQDVAELWGNGSFAKMNDDYIFLVVKQFQKLLMSVC